MGNKKTEKVEFALVKITTEQFAIIEKNYNAQSPPQMKLSFRFAANAGMRLLGIFVHINIECEKQPFIVLECGCHFKIRKDSWDELLDEAANRLTISKSLIQHLAVISVGTARGILHAKTENTSYNHFFLPTINLTEMIAEDVILPLNSSSA
jgi:hypothetical protein